MSHSVTQQVVFHALILQVDTASSHIISMRDKLRDKKARVATPIDEQELDYIDLDQDILFDNDAPLAGPSGQALTFDDDAPVAGQALLPTPSPPVVSKRLGCAIRMPRRFVDYLPGSDIPLAHMPRQQAENHPSPPRPLSQPSDKGLPSINQPLAESFKTEPDSMGLYRIYPTRPTFIPPNDSSLINCTDAPTLEGERATESSNTHVSIHSS
ncbi:hypothetical protein DFJ58DRAFT_733060 [Suillus subalutaceus]|uniref:uncharacterized protein n=1 Tax=Suillus subalutaceus TaxID=48586 RepID=UPI001B881734|nr:uncharacterized protein DFJ58DRAFT_733060 [Suillus subalutaceus]KAG1839963.1 hypothetical protein DFJ58DRAFT_733060 [Suillus subalutaceus]